MLKRLLLGVILLLIIAGGAGWFSYQQYLETPVNLDEKTRFTVEHGAYFNSVAAKLQGKAVIERSPFLRVLARLHPELTHLRAGEYELTPGMTPVQLFSKLTSGDTVKYDITIVAGTRYKNLRDQLRHMEGIRQTLGDTSDSELMKQLNIDAPSLEGQFLAETYQYERGNTDLSILQRAHKALQKTLKKAWASKADKLPLESAYEALTLASIIEKETGVAAERPKIAGVFVRRLQRGMLLQTDPTVIYGMGDRYKGNITYRDLRAHTPYNTYVIKGLPPTPIALVGREAIEAAVHPADGKALYFVAKGDGHHVFSNSLRAHNAAVRKYQLRRKSDYRSSPK